LRTQRRRREKIEMNYSDTPGFDITSKPWAAISNPKSPISNRLRAQRRRREKIEMNYSHTNRFDITSKPLAAISNPKSKI